MHPNDEKFNYEVANIAQRLIGKACAIRRKELGYNQGQLAEKVGTTQQHIASFEAGRQNLSIRTFIAILGSLDMHIDLRAKDGDRPAGFPEVTPN